MWQHKGMNVLLSTEMQQCSRVFVAFCLHNFPKHFLQPCTGHEGARPTTEVSLERIGLCQSGRFSTLAVRLCSHVTPHAADTTPRLPAIHVPALCPGTQCQHTVFCCLTSAYHGGRDFFLYLSSFSSFFCWIFGSSASIPLGLFFFLLLRNEGCTHIFSLLALSSSREGSGKLPPSPSGTHCPHSQWLTHGHLAFHIVSTISSPKWEGRSSAYPHSVLCPFQGLWMTTDGILKRSGWIMHFRFSSQSETLWVGNEKENFR